MIRSPITHPKALNTYSRPLEQHLSSFWVIRTVYLLHITEYINFDQNKVDRISIEFKKIENIIQIIKFIPIKKHSKLNLSKIYENKLIKYHNKINDLDHHDFATGA